MQIELKNNELEPLCMSTPNFWTIAVSKIFDDPDKTLPVYLEDHRTEEPLGSFFLRIINQQHKHFIQIEGFDSPDIEKVFLQFSSKEWVRLQPGIYRLDISV